MALNTSKCSHLTPLRFKGLTNGVVDPPPNVWGGGNPSVRPMFIGFCLYKLVNALKIGTKKLG